MKLNCDKISLCEAVANVMKAVSARSTLPILEGISLQAENGKLILTGYDLEIGITTEIEANITEPGSVVLTASYFYNIIRKMPGDRILLITDEKYKTTIESGVTSFHILGMAQSDYPEIPSLEEENHFSLPQPLLKNMIDMTLFAVAPPDSSRPVQTGSYFEIEHGVFHLVSVDGFRLALRREVLEDAQEVSCRFVVPGKALSEISRLIDSVGEKEGHVVVRFSGKHALFEIHNYTVISRLLEGEFLDYRASIPVGFTTRIDVETHPFLEAIDRTSLLITERLKSPLRCHFTEEGISISCVTTVGRSYDEIPSKMEGEEVDMGFNNRYLLEALRASHEERVFLEISGPLSPMKVLPKESDSFLYLVLPMRLKSNDAN